MTARSFCVKLVVAAALIVTAPWLSAQDGLQGALSRTNFAASLNLAAPLRQTLAIGDFDKDNRLDGAVLVDSGRLSGRNGFRIELHLSASSNTELAFESAENTLAITAWDINKDGATDVIVEQPLTHRLLYVWLNDGHGGFHRGQIEDFPSASTTTSERLEAPSPPQDCPGVCLGPQRGGETAKLTAHPRPSLPPSKCGFRALSKISPAVSLALASYPSRAPPLS